MRKRQAFRFALIIPILVAGYFGSAALVLDFSQMAYPYDEEYFEGKPVAFGPQPRIRLCRPAYFDVPGGASYDGSEWALVVYRPICQFWAARRGYAPPSRWR